MCIRKAQGHLMIRFFSLIFIFLRILWIMFIVNKGIHRMKRPKDLLSGQTNSFMVHSHHSSPFFGFLVAGHSGVQLSLYTYYISPIEIENWLLIKVQNFGPIKFIFQDIFSLLSELFQSCFMKFSCPVTVVCDWVFTLTT